MKNHLFVITTILLALSCTKEQPETSKPNQTVPASEFEALKKEVEELKTTIASLTSGTDLETLKQENEALKAQVELLTSGFFEVDGLRFDKNGTLISVPKLEDKTTENVGYNTILTTTRKYDTDGRVIEILRDYKNDGMGAAVPYNWQKILFEYSGKMCKTTTQTSKSGLPAGTNYEEVITQQTYW